MSSEKQRGVCQYVVVETRYPTNYGCYSGHEWSVLDRMRNTTIEASDPFETFNQAVEHAKKIRDRSGWFDDGYDDDDEDDAPPYDSADMENFDNDEEILIEVMTVAEHAAREEERQKEFHQAAAEQKFQHVFRAKMRKQQVLSAQRVFYCLPPCREGEEDYGIPAQLEIDDSTDVASLSSSFLSQINSLKYEPKSKVEYGEKNAENVALFQVLSKCKQLQELHLHMKNHQPTGMLNKDFVCGIHKSLNAPNLTVLVIQNCSLSPDAVKALAQFDMLEHLDIMDTFEYQLVVEAMEQKYGNNDSDEEEQAPYESALSAIGIELVEDGNLMRLDLGYGYDKSMLKELVGADCLWAVSGDLEEKGGELTTTNCREPADWRASKDKQDAKKRVLKEIAGDEDQFIAAIAKDKLNELQ